MESNAIREIRAQASSTTVGNVVDYLMDEQVQQGQAGTPSMIRSMQYIAHTADLTTAGDHAGATAYPLANQTEYNGTSSPVTTYTYGWVTGTGGFATTIMQSKSTTRPIISTAQNGPGGTQYDVSDEIYDSLGHLQWTMDGDGFITYTICDPGTNQPTTRISDVNTSDTSDFSSGDVSLPSGWTTPSGGGKHLKSTMVVDGLGRTTEITDPNGNVTYTIYNDANHEVRTYPGWQTGSKTTTGPVQVQREDRSTATIYLETMTMAPSPSDITVDSTTGAPTGLEAVSNVQTLTRQLLDNSSRVAEVDQYYGGISYSTTPQISARELLRDDL